MRKLEHSAPGACWVEIISVRDKDGFRNDRYFLEGCASVFFITGGLRECWAFFRGIVRLEHGKPVEIEADTYLLTRLDSAAIQINEIESDVLEIEIRESIYRLRILNEAESNAISEAVSAAWDECSTGE